MDNSLLPEMNSERLASQIAQVFNTSPAKVASTLKLFDDGATIPFIARYRKEATQGLDEVQLADIEREQERLTQLHEKKLKALTTIQEAGKLTSELHAKFRNARILQEVEDLYLPYKPRKRTRGLKAREAGLEPLADALRKGSDAVAQRLLGALASEEFETRDAMLGGARDIISEELAEVAPLRERLRQEVMSESRFQTKAKKDGDPEGKFDSLLNMDEGQRGMASHRILGLFRSENAGALRVKLATNDDRANQESFRYLPEVRSQFARKELDLAAQDAWKRLLKPSLENELRSNMKAWADEEAIEVFALNLRKVLLNPPLGEHAVIGVDPGFRTGCKVALVSPQGDFVENTTIFPHPPQKEQDKAADILKAMIARHSSDFPILHIAYGNGTASRETADFLARFIKELGGTFGALEAHQVNESGASIYSASEIAREEFAHLDLTVRGAISIARRLQDPLAELIKLDPKSIGVGQYQHDVDQKLLSKSLDRVVESCVNMVGVDLNTASWALLRYVSGISPKIAKAITDHRAKTGRFTERKELLKVAGLGPKAYELCAGFLRIRGGKNLLDNTAVHPERYGLVAKVCKALGMSIIELVEKPEVLNQLNPNDFVDAKAGVGLPTVEDIFDELSKPGRDPRGHYEKFSYDERVHSVEDLVEGMDLPGIVTNVTNFGCFVDVGVHQDGLVHISELSDRFVKDPAEVVSVGDQVRVRVLEVDTRRSRIALSRKALLGNSG